MEKNIRVIAYLGLSGRRGCDVKKIIALIFVLFVLQGCETVEDGAFLQSVADLRELGVNLEISTVFYPVEQALGFSTAPAFSPIVHNIVLSAVDGGGVLIDDFEGVRVLAAALENAFDFMYEEWLMPVTANISGFDMFGGSPERIFLDRDLNDYFLDILMPMVDTHPIFEVSAHKLFAASREIALYIENLDELERLGISVEYDFERIGYMFALAELGDSAWYEVMFFPWEIVIGLADRAVVYGDYEVELLAGIIDDIMRLSMGIGLVVEAEVLELAGRSLLELVGMSFVS